MKITVRCEDKYQAQNLLRFAHPQDKTSSQLAEVLDIIDKECVVALHDSSAHSVLLYDARDAVRLADFVQSVRDGVHKIVGAWATDETVTIEKR